MKAILSVNKMSAGTKRSNADEDNNDETPTNANTGIVISEPVKRQQQFTDQSFSEHVISQYSIKQIT